MVVEIVENRTKSANYGFALIAKAIFGKRIKLIIIGYCGAHNDLRAQTQARLNEEILGYDRADVAN